LSMALANRLLHVFPPHGACQLAMLDHPCSSCCIAIAIPKKSRCLYL
jgi:hypothetical protein